MSTSNLSVKTVVFYILVSGVVIFLAVFLGIQAGFAIRGGDGTALTPENLPNNTSMVIDDAVPDLTVRSANGTLTTLSEVTGGHKTLIGVVMPGCSPCTKFLEYWTELGMPNYQGDFSVILLAGTATDDPDLVNLADYTENYTVYTCDLMKLSEQCGLKSFPSILGIGENNKISFVANAFVGTLDLDFFHKYL